MSKQEEYNQLLRERDETQSAYDSTEAKIEELEYIIKRLKAAKADIVDMKNDYKLIKKANKAIINDDYEWTGSNYDEFLSKGSSLMGEDTYYYKYVLDHVLDSLNDEITDVENKKNDQYGILGDLLSALNSIGNAIENFFN